MWNLVSKDVSPVDGHKFIFVTRVLGRTWLEGWIFFLFLINHKNYKKIGFMYLCLYDVCFYFTSLLNYLAVQYLHFIFLSTE